LREKQEAPLSGRAVGLPASPGIGVLRIQSHPFDDADSKYPPVLDRQQDKQTTQWHARPMLPGPVSVLKEGMHFSKSISSIVVPSITLIIRGSYLQCRVVVNTVVTEDNRR
jgi:hypothetical protein